MTTNQDLQITLARIEERQINVVEKLDEIKKWQQSHETKDEERFANLNKYGASIAMVASVCTAGVMLLWEKLKKLVTS